MRKIFMIAASLTFVGALAANAQETTTPQTPAQPPAAETQAAPSIQRVNVIDVTELPQETQKQVDDLVQQSSDDSLQQLRTSIDAIPQAKAALEAKGASSEQVVATSMGADGTLTLITKKAS